MYANHHPPTTFQKLTTTNPQQNPIHPTKPQKPPTKPPVETLPLRFNHEKRRISTQFLNQGQIFAEKMHLKKCISNLGSIFFGVF
jgi:hypothetical protein